MAVTVAIIGRLGFFFFFFVRFAEQRHLPSLLENVENIGKKFQNFSSKRLLISIFPHMLIQIFGLCFYVSSLFDYFIYFSRFNCPIVDLPPWIPGANCLPSFDNSWETPIVTISNNNRSHVPKSIVQYLSIKLYNSTIFNFSNYNLDNRDEIRREFL